MGPWGSAGEVEYHCFGGNSDHSIIIILINCCWPSAEGPGVGVGWFAIDMPLNQQMAPPWWWCLGDGWLLSSAVNVSRGTTMVVVFGRWLTALVNSQCQPRRRSLVGCCVVVRPIPQEGMSPVRGSSPLRLTSRPPTHSSCPPSCPFVAPAGCCLSRCLCCWHLCRLCACANPLIALVSSPLLPSE
jgi:hypothetical protein